MNGIVLKDTNNKIAPITPVSTEGYNNYVFNEDNVDI